MCRQLCHLGDLGSVPMDCCEEELIPVCEALRCCVGGVRSVLGEAVSKCCVSKCSQCGTA